MFNPRRVIPKLAVAALALTGCGETGSPDGTLAASLEAFCMKLVDCFPDSPYYSTTEGCVSVLTADYGLDGPISSECEAAAISYFQCGTPLTCQELANPDGNSCDDEFDAAGAACN